MRLPQRNLVHDPEKLVLDVIGDGNQFPAFAKARFCGRKKVGQDCAQT